MVKKLSFEVSDKTYEQLSGFAEFYDKNIEEIVRPVLKFIGSIKDDIPLVTAMLNGGMMRPSIPNFDIKKALLNTFSNPGLLELSKGIRDRLDVDGKYVLEDVEYDKDAGFRISYAETNRNKTYDINEICFEKEEDDSEEYEYSCVATVYIDPKETSRESLERLKAIAADHDELYLGGVKIEFHYDVDPDAVGYLHVSYCGYEIDDLPKLKKIDKQVKGILKKAGVTIKRQD